MRKLSFQLQSLTLTGPPVRCYGYVSGTQTKIIAVLDDNENIRENEIEKVSRKSVRIPPYI